MKKNILPLIGAFTFLLWMAPTHSDAQILKDIQNNVRKTSKSVNDVSRTKKDVERTGDQVDKLAGTNKKNDDDKKSSGSSSNSSKSKKKKNKKGKDDMAAKKEASAAAYNFRQMDYHLTELERLDEKPNWGDKAGFVKNYEDQLDGFKRQLDEAREKDPDFDYNEYITKYGDYRSRFSRYNH